MDKPSIDLFTIMKDAAEGKIVNKLPTQINNDFFSIETIISDINDKLDTYINGYKKGDIEKAPQWLSREFGVIEHRLVAVKEKLQKAGAYNNA